MHELILKIKSNKNLIALLKNLILYGLIGGTAAVLDYGIFALVNHLSGSTIPEISSICGQTVGFIFSFTLNTFINFKKTDKLLKRFLSYLVIVLIGMAITTVAIYLLKNIIDIYLLKFLCLVVVSLIQFILNKTITYGE